MVTCMQDEALTRATNEAPDSPFSDHITFYDVKARLSCLNHTEEAKRLGVDRRTFTNVMHGLRLWSPLLPKIARRIKVPTEFLRSYFTELASHRDGSSTSEVA